MQKKQQHLPLCANVSLHSWCVTVLVTQISLQCTKATKSVFLGQSLGSSLAPVVLVLINNGNMVSSDYKKIYISNMNYGR